MHIHLVLPGLLWPDSSAASITEGLRLPALMKLLRHARIGHESPVRAETWLAHLFGFDSHADIPLGTLRRLGEAESTQDSEGYWLCADPVHLYFAQEHLLLSDAADLDISDDEAQALVASLNDFFVGEEDDFLRFEACTPTRWYLQLKKPLEQVSFHPLADAIGRPIAHFLPEGEQARRWGRIANEIQMLLHNHPVNVARENAGRPEINSLWFWGEGNLHVAQMLAAPAPQVLASDPLTRGLALITDTMPVRPDALPNEDALITLDDLRDAAVHIDAEKWRSCLAALETNWFAPLLAALKTRALSSLHISAPGDRYTLKLEIQGRDLRKFWRHSGTLATLIASTTIADRYPSFSSSPLTNGSS